MAVGINIWIGVRDPNSDDPADARTAAASRKVCWQRIKELGDDGRGLVPGVRLVILKGRMSDR